MNGAARVGCPKGAYPVAAAWMTASWRATREMSVYRTGPEDDGAMELRRGRIVPAGNGATPAAGRVLKGFAVWMMEDSDTF